MLSEETFDMLFDEKFMVRFYRVEEPKTKVFHVCELIKFDLVFDELLRVAGWMEKEKWNFDGISAEDVYGVILKFKKELISDE